ncbi:MAG: adenosylcobinamide-GDP ribazoletransferase [Alphaproteobacteria bacterium]|nr:adenosylcobinamide-GDP ribazoletransferase [Alphaproteobacteria bacterium]
MRFDAPTTDSTRAALAELRDDVIAATSFLTRLPVARFASDDTGLLARSMRAFPIVGIVVGLIGWAAFAIATALALPASIASLLALVATVLTTGALHEDGLADTADGFGGGEDTARKLAIMRDSRSGAFGIIALVFSLALRGAALVALAGSDTGVGFALIAAHVVSRAALPIVMRQLVPARSDGLGASAGQPDDAAIAWCLGIGIIAALICFGLTRGILALLVTAAAVALLAALARRQIGGYTGDVLGAAQQIGEITMLLTAAAA